MPYNNITSRADAQALVPEEVSDIMMGKAIEESAVLSAFTRVPVGTNQTRFPVTAALPLAYWVTGDTGLKQTTEMNWANKFLNIEEAATIMPIPDAVAADIQGNVWDRSMPYIVEAFGRLIDSTVFFGTNAPSSFPQNISAAAAAAGNTVTEGATAANGGFYGDIDALIGKVEEDGYDVSAFVGARSVRGRFRTARNTGGDRLDAMRLNGGLSELDGVPILYPMRGLFPAGGVAGTNVRLFAGDFSEFVIGVRQDITVDIFREGVIQDNTGAIIYNLMQQDMTAIRVTFRVGWQVSNRINNDQAVEANRYPVARLMY